jgi:hypothetical protein
MKFLNDIIMKSLENEKLPFVKAFYCGTEMSYSDSAQPSKTSGRNHQPSAMFFPLTLRQVEVLNPGVS